VLLTIAVKYCEAKQAVIAALRSGRFQHESRRNIDVKNLLAMGEVTPEFVERVIVESDETQHVLSSHHRVATINVHVIASSGWYVKFYFVGDPDTMFISVHQ
jgi:hypothetical protein